MTEKKNKKVYFIMLLLLLLICFISSVSLINGKPKNAVSSPIKKFAESFIFKGDHSAVIKDGTATTVWWNADSWDVRADTSNNAISSKGKGHHVDIHASNSDLTSGAQANKLSIGGDGSQGVGVMHVDFESIVSARLRNPLLISKEPGVIEFRASNFVTTAHWWEIAIAPANIVTGAEFTSIPSSKTHFDGNPGPGHVPYQDSLNFIVMGKNDVPCTAGWQQKAGITSSINGKTIQAFASTYLNVVPGNKDKLYAWRLEVYPDKVMAFADLNEDGVKEHFYTFNVNIPWKEVYVYFIAAAYQADHHPQNGKCGAYQGQVREFPWKDIKVSPVKYGKTKAYPKESGIQHTHQDTGWTGYDIRDTQRFGPMPALKIPISQPNPNQYDKHASMAFCNEVGNGWFNCEGGSSAKSLSLNLPSESVKGIANAQLVYDIKREGYATLYVNGKKIGKMPEWKTVSYPKANDAQQWVQRSIKVEPSILKEGTNEIRIEMSGNVGFDRLQFEFGYG